MKEKCMEIKALLKEGAVGNYSYCEIIQVILYEKEKNEYWNYFTHLSFSCRFQKGTERIWLTGKPLSINRRFRVMVSKQILPADTAIDIVDRAAETQKWEFEQDCAFLDECFVIDPRYVPETDNSGNLDEIHCLVPIEKSLYGSNFMGNYYVIELFSTKKYLNEILTDTDKRRIQETINKCHLQFDLISLFDRVGNVVCKLCSEVINHHPLKLAPENGITGRFSRTESTNAELQCFLNILKICDHTIIDNEIIPFTLSDDNPVYEYCIEPNRFHNRITVLDQHTGIIYYAADRDYSFSSGYYSQITPPYYVTATSKDRMLFLDGQKKIIPTHNFSGQGTIDIEKEIYEFQKRENIWKDRQIEDSYFFKTFMHGDQQLAITTVINILNNQSIFWDLKEVWLIDPYLSAEDILKTAVHCKKYGIVIKCLTCINTINSERATQIEVEEGEDRFIKSKEKYRKTLKDTVPTNTDIKLEFRTVHGHYGEPFHDRYLIMKYGINKCRAWSLGISVNALGTSHHSIQIVESPESVAKLFEMIWNKTDNAECLIYSNCKVK